MENHEKYILPNNTVIRVYQRNYCRYFITLCAICISGLGFSYSFVENLVSGALINYVPPTWNTMLAVIAISSTEGLSSIFIFVLTIISCTYMGPFKTILLSTACYLLGLLLIALCRRETSFDSSTALFLVGAVLVSVGKAVKKPVLKGFLVDQFCVEYNNNIHGDDSQEHKTNVWWPCACVLGVLCSIIYNLATSDRSHSMNVIVSIAVMGVAYCIFSSGFCFYIRRKPTRTSRSLFCRVFQTTDLIRVEEEEEEEEKNHIFKMFWMWAIMIVYSLVKMAGVTFFYEDVSDDDAQLSVSILLMISEFSSSGISFICEWVISKMQLSERQKKDAALIRIIFGLTCCILCCITAYLFERGRVDSTEVSDYMMVPQFLCLGLTTGLVESGLDDLLLFYVPKSWEVYGSTFNDLALGLLNFLNIPFVIGCHWWINDSETTVRLDHYYLLLAVLSSLNWVSSLYVCTLYRGEEVSENISTDVVLEMVIRNR